jgi:hypothetical protein
MPFYTGHIAAASNRADLIFQVTIIDPTTNAPLDLTGGSVTVALRMAGKYGNSPLLTGSTVDGHISFTSPGTFSVNFSRAEMVQFPPGDLDIGITLLLDGVTYQLFAGQLPVVDGVVAA